MATGIQWTDETWNPLVGCEAVSPGCDNCYAAREASGRLAQTAAYEGLARFGRFTGEVRLLPDRLGQPLRWAKPRMVFVNSMSDLFHADVPEQFIAQVFAVMAFTQRHTYQVLTKRHARLRALMASPAFIQMVRDETAKLLTVGRPDFRVIDEWPLPNVWLGVSAEDQYWAEVRIPLLLATPAAVRFVSAEPLIGPMTLYPGRWIPPLGGGPRVSLTESWQVPPPALDWVIIGGESGPGCRKCALSWIYALVDECRSSGTAVFVKQLGQYGRRRGKGGDPIEWPEDLRDAREYPEVMAGG